ncbi:MAG: hypothetical protein M0Q19_00195 [Candidatus Cloacimonetes bacterium]|jgi:hypothetical protein|nr:hypothetical protein [Candidatus Cloacimonadota bacterium]MCK9331576.1 hypothetical protein [Candidatus Cloacimonadota bacterium]
MIVFQNLYLSQITIDELPELTAEILLSMRDELSWNLRYYLDEARGCGYVQEKMLDWKDKLRIFT